MGSYSAAQKLFQVADIKLTNVGYYRQPQALIDVRMVKIAGMALQQVLSFRGTRSANYGAQLRT